MLVRSLTFCLLILITLTGILSSCSRDGTWLVKFNYQNREYSVRIGEVKKDLLLMARRQRRISTDLEWHKNYLFSKYLSAEIAVLEELNRVTETATVATKTPDDKEKQKALIQFRTYLRSKFAEKVLPTITDRVLRTYYENNKAAAVRKQDGKTVQLTFAQVKQEIYEVVCEDYWNDFVKNWNEDMRKKYVVEYNEDGIRLLMDMEREYLDKITQAQGPNLALHKQASASSALNNEKKAGMAFDGKQETAWVPAADGGPQWIIVDMGEKKQFRKVVLNWGKDFPACFTIQASEDGRLWSNVYLVNKSTGGGNEVNEVLFERTKKRFIKILINDNNGYALREFQVYN
jgi:hypothetical protein